MERASNRRRVLVYCASLETVFSQVPQIASSVPQNSSGWQLGATYYSSRNYQRQGGSVTLASESFGRSQTSLFVFSGVTLSMKFLDITSFGFFELGANSDKNLAVGAISIIVVGLLIVNCISILLELTEKYIDDGRVGIPKVPDFSLPENFVHPVVVRFKFYFGYILFFLLKIVPIIFGVICIIIVSKDLAYFFEWILGRLSSGGQL